jgi:hypothetical protein
VPHHCVGEQVELHAGDKLIEVYFHNKRIATHPVIKKSTPNILPIFKLLLRTKSSFF